MTKREAAIISAYTGILIGKFSDLHKYVQEKFDREVLTIEFASKHFESTLKKLSKSDFLNIKVEE